MSKLPNTASVERNFKLTHKAVESALHGLNQHAAQLMAQGKYEQAQEEAELGKSIIAFMGELNQLRDKWRHLAKGGSAKALRKANGAKTPLWGYYQPILKALVSLGGAAKRTDLEPIVREQMLSVFLAGDRDSMSQGRERWQVMIYRARRALAKEGWIEPGVSPLWKITEEGRRAAQAAFSNRIHKL